MVSPALGTERASCPIQWEHLVFRFPCPYSAGRAEGGAATAPVLRCPYKSSAHRFQWRDEKLKEAGPGVLRNPLVAMGPAAN